MVRKRVRSDARPGRGGEGRGLGFEDDTSKMARRGVIGQAGPLPWPEVFRKPNNIEKPLVSTVIFHPKHGLTKTKRSPAAKRQFSRSVLHR
ncbi:hypothetical protein KM043_012778 [Ampulex compressa]|nr:hypothetical protein KM043_012778 [Ampulex compressa]